MCEGEGMPDLRGQEGRSEMKEEEKGGLATTCDTHIHTRAALEPIRREYLPPTRTGTRTPKARLLAAIQKSVVVHQSKSRTAAIP